MIWEDLSAACIVRPHAERQNALYECQATSLSAGDDRYENNY